MISRAACLGIFESALSVLADAFHTLEDALPPPVVVQTAHGWSPRYRPELIEHALLMKLARLISVVSALRRLVETGQIQEQGILERAADETVEDISFLAFGKQNGLRAIHRQYLRFFWREEFEGLADPKSYRPRHMVRRGEIRAYLNQSTSLISDGVSRMLYGVFSGFVHGASTHIFDLLDPETGRYRLSGVQEEEERLGYLYDAANYPLRCLMAGVVVARSLGEGATANNLLTHVDRIKAEIDSQKTPTKAPPQEDP